MQAWYGQVSVTMAWRIPKVERYSAVSKVMKQWRFVQNAVVSFKKV